MQQLTSSKTTHFALCLVGKNSAYKVTLQTQNMVKNSKEKISLLTIEVYTLLQNQLDLLKGEST